MPLKVHISLEQQMTVADEGASRNLIFEIANRCLLQAYKACSEAFSWQLLPM